MNNKNTTLVILHPGIPERITLPASEVCLHMGVAGATMWVEPYANGMCQLWKDGYQFSGPLLWGEAGIYRDSGGGPYAYRRFSMQTAREYAIQVEALTWALRQALAS